MSLKNAIEKEVGSPVRVRAGAPGSLRILLDGEPLYSKKQAGRPPDLGEIFSLIRTKIARQ